MERTRTQRNEMRDASDNREDGHMGLFDAMAKPGVGVGRSAPDRDVHAQTSFQGYRADAAIFSSEDSKFTVPHQTHLGLLRSPSRSVRRPGKTATQAPVLSKGTGRVPQIKLNARPPAPPWP